LLSAGCVFSDFGTRRRASFEAQDVVVRAMKDCANSQQWPGKLVGTSNVYLAMKYDLTPVGTMAHEFMCATAAMYGPQMANHMAMEAWRNTFRGALGVVDVIPNLFIVCVEYMSPILMHIYAIFFFSINISPNMVSLFND
jgi:nicotinic acid phosphoribosyltransferase